MPLGRRRRAFQPSGTLAAPVNTVLPSIAGLPGVGVQLSATFGVWTGFPAPTFAYQWKRDGSNIGTNSPFYTLVLADVGALITCVVTATNSQGSANATTSNSVGPVVPLPSKTSDPVASVSSAVVGQTASVTSGGWDDALSFAYQWFENGVAVPGATSTTFLLSTAGASVYCRVTATNTGGSTSQNSNTLGPVGIAPQNTAAPVISGTAAAGSTLTRTTGSWSGYPASYTYATKWYADGVEIAGQTGSTIVLTAVQAAKLITCTVVATNSTGSSIPATSNSLGPVTSAPSFETDPVLSGSPAVGNALTVTTTGLYGYPVPSLGYVWKANGLTISGATASVFTLTSGQEAKDITVDVTATNVHGSDTATTNSVGPVDPPEPVAGEWDLVAADGKVLLASDGQRLVASDYTSDTLYDLTVTPKPGGTTAAFNVKARPRQGRFSAIVVPAGTFSSPNPLPTDIEDWAMNAGVRPSYIKWSTYFDLSSVPSADPGVFGLIQLTDYDFYATLRNSEAIDDFGNVVTEAFTTEDAAPVIANPLFAAKDTTMAVGSWTTTDQTGSSKVSIYLQSSPTPSEDDIIAGTGAVRSVITKSNTATGRVSLADITGLPAGASLRAYVIQIDSNGNRSNVISYDFTTPAVATVIFQHANTGAATGLLTEGTPTITTGRTDPLGGSNAVRFSWDPAGTSKTCSVLRRTTGGLVPTTFELQYFIKKQAWASLEAWIRNRVLNTLVTPSNNLNLLDGTFFAPDSAIIYNQRCVPMEDGYYFVQFTCNIFSSSGTDTDGDYKLSAARSATTPTIQTTGDHAFDLFDFKMLSH